MTKILKHIINRMRKIKKKKVHALDEKQRIPGKNHFLRSQERLKVLVWIPENTIKCLIINIERILFMT